MVRVGSYEAKTHLPQLLSRVAAGESIIITRHGQEVARLVPPPEVKNEARAEFEKALARWRKKRKGITLGGLKVRDLINEGRALMAWVFDASIAATWCFDNERTAETETLFDRLGYDPATVPNLLHLELANVLTQAMRKKPPRISGAQRTEFMATLGKSPITVDDQTAASAWKGTLDLADKFRLSTYDAAYLELALRMGVELATLDRELRAAAVAAGVRVIP